MSNDPNTKPRSPLERLRSGELTLDGYLDAKVLEATHHLRFLPQPRLLEIRTILRGLLETDPALIDLVRRATTSPDN
jgi:hypothetical protein